MSGSFVHIAVTSHATCTSPHASTLKLILVYNIMYWCTPTCIHMHVYKQVFKGRKYTYLQFVLLQPAFLTNKGSRGSLLLSRQNSYACLVHHLPPKCHTQYPAHCHSFACLWPCFKWKHPINKTKALMCSLFYSMLDLKDLLARKSNNTIVWLNLPNIPS